LFLAQEALAKAFGSRVTQWGFAKLDELPSQAVAFGFGGLGLPAASAEFSMRLAGVVNPSLNVLRELPGLWIAGVAFEQRQFLVELFGFGFDMSQTGLALLGVDAVVSSVGIGDENAAKVIAQELLGGFCGTVGLKDVGRQVLIAAIPNPVGNAIVAPGSFVGMGNGQRADFVEQINVERQTATHVRCV